MTEVDTVSVRIGSFTTNATKQADVMFADLVTGRFSGIAFKMLRIDPETGVARAVTIDADFGEKLVGLAAVRLGDTA